MRDVIRRAFVLLSVAFPLVLAAACRPQSTPAAGGTPVAAPEAYVPGLGEMMSLQQMRHAKLWFAGQAGNWELAAYEIDELGEGFDDIVKFHPTHKDSPVAPKDAIPRMVTEPLKDLRAAIDKKDSQTFERAYNSLTTACNSCHKATNFAFNAVQTPATNPFPNQVFAAGRR
jgi:hypothetical protein